MGCSEALKVIITDLDSSFLPFPWKPPAQQGWVTVQPRGERGTLMLRPSQWSNTLCVCACVWERQKEWTHALMEERGENEESRLIIWLADRQQREPIGTFLISSRQHKETGRERRKLTPDQPDGSDLEDTSSALVSQTRSSILDAASV